MRWKSWIGLFIIKRDITQNIQFNKNRENIMNNIEMNNNRWETMRNINNNNGSIFKVCKNSMYDGCDHRPINETNNIYNIKKNHFKMKLLKRLENKDISVQDKLEIINGDKWFFNDDKNSSFYVNLLAGDLLDNW